MYDERNELSALKEGGFGVIVRLEGGHWSWSWVNFFDCGVVFASVSFCHPNASQKGICKQEIKKMDRR
jgi:hypothetical protein